MDDSRLADLLARERAALDERTRASGDLHERARRTLVGGVASSFQRREPWPVSLERGEGARVWDVDGNEYLDFHTGFGAMVQGHAHPAVAAAVAARAPLGTHFGAPTAEAIAVAEELARRFGLERWRFTNSGTESTMAAIRIARAVTRRDDVLKVFGAYHGHHDAVMVSVGVPAGALGDDPARPPSLAWGAGIPASTVEQVHAVPFNDADALERRIAALEAEGRPPGCLIMEGAMTGAGLIPPEPGYLDAVRAITRRAGVLVILDEVKTGFTIAAGGATERFAVSPDLVTLAKALGAGLPSGAVGMTGEVAGVVEDGSVHHLGTFNGTPLGMAAARASLDEVLTPAAYARLEALGERMAAGCSRVLAEHDLDGRSVALGSKGCVTHGSERVRDYATYRRRHDPQLAELVWLWQMNRGLFVTPGREQDWSLTVAHDEAAVDRYVDVFAELAAELSRRSSGFARA